jgi:hypothetical protein
MRIQATLTTSESKKLIAKGVSQIPSLKKALEEGLVAIHPSSTTYFLLEELTGIKPEGVWICGAVFPKGMCISYERQQTTYLRPIEHPKTYDPEEFLHTWVLERGVFQTGIPLRIILGKMGKNDVYIKGANAIDIEGRVGVLYASKGAGTIGKVIMASRRKKFLIILPVGVEKMIPDSIFKAAKTASREKTEIAMGIPVGLIPVSGQVVTEVEAITLISGAEAVVISCGGLAGAEGATTLVIKGAEEKVRKALKVIQTCKGATLPFIKHTDCSVCFYPTCHYREKKITKEEQIVQE